MEPYRLILITVHGGGSYHFSTASVGTSIAVDRLNLRTSTGGEPDPGLHSQQSIGMANSGGVQWIPPAPDRDYIALGPEVALAGLCTVDAMKSFAMMKRL